MKTSSLEEPSKLARTLFLQHCSNLRVFTHKSWKCKILIEEANVPLDERLYCLSNLGEFYGHVLPGRTEREHRVDRLPGVRDRLIQ